MFVFVGSTFKYLNVKVRLGRSVKIIDSLNLADCAKVGKYEVNVFVKDKLRNITLYIIFRARESGDLARKMNFMHDEWELISPAAYPVQK